MASIANQIRQSVARGAYRGGIHIHRAALTNVSGRVLNRRTGLLANSLFFEVRQSVRTSLIVGVRGPASVYGGVFEFTGRKRLFIRPVRARALRFKPKGSGFYRFSRGHWIPEQKPKPFLAPAIDEQKQVLLRSVRDEVMQTTARAISRTISIRR